VGLGLVGAYPTRNDYSKIGAIRKRLLPQENDYKKQTGSEAEI